MFIKKISKFLEGYDDITKSQFMKILSWNNPGFDDYKFEKDFLLTLILIKFWEKYPDLVFKWGTCLNKIYFPYFRMSEDLDFVLNSDAWQTTRRKIFKQYENDFIADLSILGISLREGRTKFDTHKLAMFTFEYNSIINNSIQTIKIDISLKNKLYLAPIPWIIQSIYIDKIMEENIFDTHYINCIDLKESTAEKLRAALTRRTPAIRDFFDIWYIKYNWGFDFDDRGFRDLLKLKLKEVDFDYTLDDNYDLLVKQIQTDLKPVLNEDFDFDFDEIYSFILSFKE